MIRHVAALVVVVSLVVPANAAPRKVMVLPLDGSASADVRKKLSASVQKMARVLDGEVSAGNASFIDTATAIGCDPNKPACAEQVRSALDVSEIVYGTADQDGDTITVVVKRHRKGKKGRELSVEHEASDPPSKLEAAVLPVFGNEPLPDDPNTQNTTDPNNGNTQTPDPNNGNTQTPDPNNGKTTEPEQPGGASNRERNILIGVTAGGGLIVLLGVASWLSASSLQDDIDSARVNNSTDYERLKDLEDKASSRGWAGNVFVLIGLGVAGYGGYRLWKYYKNKEEVTVTPAPVEGGATVTIGGRW